MYIPAEIGPLEPAPELRQKIYTTHAGGKDVTRLPSLLAELEAILIDIRFAPPVQPIKWSRDYLKALLRKKYLHVPTLGDRADAQRNLSGKHSIHNLTLGIKIITELRINLLLFCNCENEKTCHRRAIGTELIKQGREVMELSNW